MQLFDDDLGTGSAEFSAVTLNETTNRLVVADDAGDLFEFDLDAEGVPLTPPRRTIAVAVGAGDIEGLAWMFETTYALAHENDGTIMVVDFDDSVTTLAAEHVVRVIGTGIEEIDGNGVEGVAYLRDDPSGNEFVVVDERPPTMHMIDSDGQVVASLPIEFGLSDVSDVWVGPDGRYSVLSDEAGVLVDFRIGGATELSLVESVDLAVGGGRFEQPEGVARSLDRSRLYIVGEAPGNNRFSLGYWRTDSD